MTALSDPHERDVAALHDAYRISEGDSVIAFINRHPDLVSPLITARRLIDQAFGPETQVDLQVERDHEIPNFEELIAVVHTSGTTVEVMRKLRVFDGLWAAAHLPQADQRINVTVTLDAA